MIISNNATWKQSTSRVGRHFNHLHVRGVIYYRDIRKTRRQARDLGPGLAPLNATVNSGGKGGEQTTQAQRVMSFTRSQLLTQTSDTGY